jgi:hypothetical protein
MEKHIAVYLRVSSKSQDTRSQEPDLKRWADAQDKPVQWYGDKFTGKTMARPGWAKLEADMRAGKVSAIVCWRLDRLGRTANHLWAELSGPRYTTPLLRGWIPWRSWPKSSTPPWRWKGSSPRTLWRLCRRKAAP